METSDLCIEAVVHQNSLKEFLLSQLSQPCSPYNDTTIYLADSELQLNRIFLGFMFPGLGHLADFDSVPNLVLCLPDFKRSDILHLARNILVPRPLSPTFKQNEAQPRRTSEEVEDKLISRIDEPLVNVAEDLQPEIEQRSDVSASRISESFIALGENRGTEATTIETITLDKTEECSEEIEIGQEVTEPKAEHNCVKQSIRHMQAHGCSDCSEKFISRQARDMHYRRIHNKHRQRCKKQFSCRYCPEIYSRQDYLKAHEINRHTGIPTADSENENSAFLKCAFCPKVFRARSLLEIHIRKHTGEKPFSCAICNLAFSNRSNLKKHGLKHAGLIQFPCSECGKQLSSQASLNDHMTIHTGERPHHCPGCGVTFKRSANIYRHKLKCQAFRLATGTQILDEEKACAVSDPVVEYAGHLVEIELEN